jgi:hypothetical protein
MIKKIKQWLESKRYFAILDASDNSVTLSKNLFLHIKNNADKNTAPSVFVFRIGRTFGFMQNPDIKTETQMCEIQYNDKYKCLGFETLCPSVNLMFYEMGLPADRKQKFYIEICKSPQDKTYYKLKRKKK